MYFILAVGIEIINILVFKHFYGEYIYIFNLQIPRWIFISIFLSIIYLAILKSLKNIINEVNKEYDKELERLYYEQVGKKQPSNKRRKNEKEK